MGKFLAIVVLFVIVAVAFSAIGRATAPQPTQVPQPNVGSSVATAVANSTIEISSESAENISLEAINTDGMIQALKIQAGLATAMSKDMKELAQSAFAANVAISTSGTAGMVAIVFVIFLGIIGAVMGAAWVNAKFGKQTEKSGGE